MCTNELECLTQISENIVDIKAFCYALAVALAIGVVLALIQKVFNYTIGKL
jgi:hypothetical protein